jgi:UDP-N-acetylmuramoyl-L-alanyl-D-glutamate--2,6-diaminopimelate ligase
VTVQPRPLAGVAAVLGVPAPGPAEVTGVTLDSRSVRPGDLYAALPGTRAHGADFVVQAAAAGAVAVLTDPAGAERAAAAGLPMLVVPRPRERLGEVAAYVYGEPARGLLLVGVTGTNGKTTVAHLLEAGLRAAGRRTGLIGTVLTRIGDAQVPSVRTTPEAPELQALLAVMREQGVDAAAMEVSSHALAQGRVDGVRYDVATFTNLSQDHLDFHGTMPAYFAAKASLFTPARATRAVVNVDDPWGRELAARATVPLTTVSVSTQHPSDWTASDVVVEPTGSSFRLRGPGGVAVAGSVQLPGRFNVDNAALAIVTLHVAGVDLERAAAGVADCAGVPGRMQVIEGEPGVRAVIDYAHTPDAVERVLTGLREGLGSGGRLLTVLGCGGDRDRDKRRLMGEVAARDSDVLVITDDNPRSEDPAAIRAAVLAGAAAVPSAERAEVVEVADRRAAIAAALARAGRGDVLAVLGKGHEQGQEIGDRTLPFDDATVVRELLAGVRA